MAIYFFQLCKRCVNRQREAREDFVNLKIRRFIDTRKRARTPQWNPIRIEIRLRIIGSHELF